MASNSSAATKQVAKASQLASECAHMVVNEPSLGAYYVMEHVQRSTPVLVDIKAGLTRDFHELSGASLDATYDCEAIAQAGSQQVLDSLARIRVELSRQSSDARR